MAKSKRSVNPADAARKAQRKRELKKNKEIRKAAREASLAKKDTSPLVSEINRLQAQERHGALDPTANARLKKLKDDLARIEKAKKETTQPMSKVQEALEARLQKQQEAEESRKLVFDPKSGKFVPAKKKDASERSGDNGEHGDSDELSGDDSESDSSWESDQDMNMIEGMDVEETQSSEAPPRDSDQAHHSQDDNDDIPLPEAPVDSDEDIDIPLPPGPPPHQPFKDQLPSMPVPPPQSVPMHRPPPPPRMPPFRPPPTHYHAMHQPWPRPPVRPSYQYQPPIATQPPPFVQPTISKEASTTATISAEPQLRDLQKELVTFVPAALRRKQAKAKQMESLPKGARADNINLAPDVE
ncbi:hypothetical protein DM01DRAFT_1336846 [Hesseltinella vesiculosa]|uniref:Wbp11/ELF5/Saf1 N-terminal domain-containing protein n=1 Tax=Hesseltinella vesiculosa TaxID=101127 RepID=A0A1X2GFE8_9FUNG|nr:hypothetical protein DM01DRAFT_1336846 [Hesseltinella vesiculosa]